MNVNHPSCQLIDGSAAAQRIRTEVALEVSRLKQNHGIEVGLGAVLNDRDAASTIYVGMKEKACAQVGIASTVIPIKADATAIRNAIESLNSNPKIHGILVQLPMPEGIDAQAMLAHVDPNKDADGLHPYNMGQLFLGQPLVAPCTPAGVMELLHLYQVPIKGRQAVVVGRSNIVGKPMAQLLNMADATTSLCHRYTADLQSYVAMADILVVAVGKPEFIPGAWIKPGATVIDVGINRFAGSKKIVGDVDFVHAKERAGYITPVPGGVGPMTVAMLLKNTVALAKRQHRMDTERC